MFLKKLHKDEVISSIRFATPSRPPIVWGLPVSPALKTKYGKKLDELIKQYPDDVSYHNIHVDYWNGLPDAPDYRWAFGNKIKPADVAIDDCPIIENWDELPQFLREIPSPFADKPLQETCELVSKNPDSYILIGFGHYFHQKLSCIRGMANLMMDYYDFPDKLHLILKAILNYYQTLLPRLAEAGVNGILGSEDLGHQKNLFMSPSIFREIFKPYYIELAKSIHSYGMDFWMHSCGHITEIIPDLIEAGIDVLHPIQVGTMDDKDIINRFSGKITFHIGMDVQHLIPFGTVAEIKKKVKERYDVFYRKDGGCIYGTGNVLIEDTPWENIKAYIETIHSIC